MRSARFLRLLTIPVVLSTLCALANAQRLDYTVDFSHPETHQVSVTLKPSKIALAKAKKGAKTVATFQMPVWAPGAYSVTNYGRYVKDFTARDVKGAVLPVKQINENRWEISNPAKLLTISYKVADSHDDTTSLLFAMATIDTSVFFANATALFGYMNDQKGVPSTVNYVMPQGWQLATPLEASGDTASNFRAVRFAAKDYDELADAPVLASEKLQTRTFTEGPASYDVVVVSDKPFPMDSLTKYTRAIVKSQTDFFSDVPFKHYSFLIYAPTLAKLTTFSQGALEHANSSDYLLVNMPWGIFKTFGVSVVSHEFFHLWNVKRIHSSLLGPFDYTQRVKTTSLWLSEGITDYYAHTLLSRYSITPVAWFYNDVTGWLSAMHATAPEVNKKTLEQLSIDESDFKMEEAMAFYTRGPLVAMLLDLEIREKSGGKKSLDDVMLALNADAKKGLTFKDEELIHKFETVTGVDLKDFYTRYISGSEPLPVESYLNKIGLTTKSQGTVSSASSEQENDTPGSRVRAMSDASPEQLSLRKAVIGPLKSL